MNLNEGLSPVDQFSPSFWESVLWEESPVPKTKYYHFPKDSLNPTESDLVFSRIKELGRGTFGKVIQVQDLQGKFFAVKKIKFIRQQDFDSFVYESQQGQELNFPQFMKIYSAFTKLKGEHNVAGYLLMEYIDGKTIGNYLKERVFNKCERCQFIINTLNIWFALLQFERLHIDPSLNNVMVSQDGTFKLIDMGGCIKKTDTILYHYNEFFPRMRALVTAIYMYYPDFDPNVGSHIPMYKLPERFRTKTFFEYAEDYINELRNFFMREIPQISSSPVQSFINSLNQGRSRNTTLATGAERHYQWHHWNPKIAYKTPPDATDFN